MRPIRYLLDENVDPIYRAGLLKRETGLIVWQVGALAAPKNGTLDPDILLWCEEHWFVLVTNGPHRVSIPRARAIR